MRPYTRIIADGRETRIAARGRIIFIDAATAALFVTVRKDETGRGDGLTIGPVTMRARNKLTTPQVFDDVTLRNESGSDVTVTVLIGESDFDAPQDAGGAPLATALDTVADITAGVAATQILPADTARQRAHLKALASNDQSIRIGDANVLVASGAQINPGEGLTIDGGAAIFCIREQAGVVDISVTVELIP